MYHLWALLLFLVFTRGSVALEDGKEYLASYVIAVGSETNKEYNLGFALHANVRSHKRADGTIAIKFDDVETGNEHEERLDLASSFKKLKDSLELPFIYDKSSTNFPLLLFGENIMNLSESVNIKRGFINLFKTYNTSSGKSYNEKVIGSGLCSENFKHKGYENFGGKTAALFNRFNSFENCFHNFRREWVETKGMKSDHCADEATISKVISYDYKVDNSSGTPFRIDSKERIRLDSRLPGNLLDEIIIRQRLRGYDIRDWDGEEYPGLEGEPSAGTALLINDDPPPETPKRDAEADAADARALAASIGLFNKLMDSLKENEVPTDLTNATLPSTLLALSYMIGKKVKPEDAAKVYHRSIDIDNKHLLMAQVLGLSWDNTKDFEVLRDPNDKESSDCSNSKDCIQFEGKTAYRDAFKLYLEKAVSQGNSGGLKTCMDYIKDLKSSQRMESTLSAICPSVFAAFCRKTYEPHLIDKCLQDFKKKIAKTSLNAKERNLWKKITLIKGLRTSHGMPFIRTVIEDKTLPLELRTQASWAMVRIGKYHSRDVQEFAVKTFEDLEEDHEIRIAAFVALTLENDLTRIGSLVQYVMTQEREEDDQVLRYIYTYFKALASVAPKPCEHVKYETARYIFNKYLSSSPFESRLTEKISLFDTSNYVFRWEETGEELMVTIIASKTDIIPRNVYIKYSDSLQSRAINFNTFGEGFVAKLIAKLKSNPESDVLFGENAENFPGNFALFENGYQIKFDSFSTLNEAKEKLLGNVMVFKSMATLLNVYNTIRVSTYSESGLKVGFFTTQGAVNRLLTPKVTNTNSMVAELMVTDIKVHLQSTTYFTSWVKLPDIDHRFVSGRRADKGLNLPKTKLFLVASEYSNATRTSFVATFTRDENKEVDIMYRSQSTFSGIVEGLNPENLPLEPQKPTQVTSIDIQSASKINVDKTIGYNRPSPKKSPLTRWSLSYQNMESDLRPYSYRVSLSPDERKNTILSTTITVDSTWAEDEASLVKDYKLLVENKAVGETSVETATAYKVHYSRERAFSTHQRTHRLRVEMYPQQVFLRSEVTARNQKSIEGDEGDEGTENIQFDGTLCFDLYGDQNKCNVISGQFKPTEAQKAVRERSEYSTDDTEKYLIACYNNHRLQGLELNVDMKKDPPQGVKYIWRKFILRLVEKHFNQLTYKVNEEPKSMVKLSINGSIDGKSNDMLIEEKNGVYAFNGFSSRLIPMMTPSTCRYKVSPIKELNRAACSLRFTNYEGNLKIVSGSSFDGKPLFDDRSLAETPCSHLLVSDCKLSNSFSVTHNRKERSSDITFGGKKITVTSKNILLDGVDKTPEDGKQLFIDGLAFYSSGGVLGVKLPNKVTFSRKDRLGLESDVLFIRVPRILKGSLCGFCGNFNGDQRDDLIPKGSAEKCN